MKDAKLFVIAAPSGAGKTTLVHAMTRHHPELRFSISYTTRPQRRNEAHGTDYLFLESEDEFRKLEQSGALLESARVFDNLYGTSREQVEEHLSNGDNVILEIDWQGAQQVRRSMPDAITIFILPPSVEELERRLRSRGTDSEEVIERRLRDALSDMSHWREFDYVIFNDELDTAVADLEAVFRGEGDASRTTDKALAGRVESMLAAPRL